MMTVESLMTRNVRTCDPLSSLAAAAKQMWDGDCGILPVVESGRLRGLITDRDVCMAVAIRGARADEIQVGDVISGDHVTVQAGDSVKVALRKMGEHQLRRLPVVGRDGELDGMLSLNDLALEAKPTGKGGGAPTYKDIATALRAIGQHRDLPVAKRVATEA